MKHIIKELGLKGLTRKQVVIVIYFTLSFMLLAISDESPVWLIILVVANFSNAVRLVRRFPWNCTN